MANVRVTAADGATVFEGDLEVVPRSGELIRRGDEVRRIGSVVWTVEDGCGDPESDPLTATIRLENAEYGE